MAAAAALAALLVAAAVPRAGAATLLFEDHRAGQHPVAKAIDLVAKLEANVIEDGKAEQQEWDKYMCWCEHTLQRKAKDVAVAKDALARLEGSIPKLGAEVASHTAEIAQLKKDVAANLEAQREASGMREGESAAFEAAKAESESSIGALEAAIAALAGAGAAKSGFLEASTKQAQLIAVAAGVKTVLDKDETAARASDQDLETLRRFVEQPSEFLAGGAGAPAASALQLGTRSQNPFGDYAPKSVQIQGVLKGLYDGFVADMEKGHGDEADKQKAFEELMATKGEELRDLQGTLALQESAKAAKAKSLAESEVERDDSGEQLQADTVFAEDTKEGCQRKAKEWSIRSRLRTQELLGLGEALKILRDPDNQAIFTKSASTFLQLSSASASGASLAARRQRRASATAGVRRAYEHLSSLARRLHSFGLARVAVRAKLGGHFDQVMGAIDQRVADLRREEGEDLEHKDRCEAAEAKNANDVEDLQHADGKAKEHIDAMDGQIADLDQKLRELGGEIAATDTELDELLELRNQARAAFEQSLKDDTMAVDIIRSAISAMAKFYKKNQAGMSLLSNASVPGYAADRDKAPETGWGAEYAGRQSQSRGALGSLEMVLADIEQEIAVSRRDEQEAEEQYETDRAALARVREAGERSRVEAEKRAAELKEKKEDKAEEKVEIGQGLSAQMKLKDTIEADCAWVKTHFADRKVARKAEIDGLQEAKSLLSGADEGDFDELSLSAAGDF